MQRLSFEEAWKSYQQSLKRMPQLPERVTPVEVAGIHEIAADFDVILVDGEGVLHDGVSGYPSAVIAINMLRKLGRKIIMLTNEAWGNRQDIALSLAQKGHSFKPEEIVTGSLVLRDLFDCSDTITSYGVVSNRPVPCPELLDQRRRLGDNASCYEEVGGVVYCDSEHWTDVNQRTLANSLSRYPRPLIVCNPEIATGTGEDQKAAPGFFAHQISEETGVEAIFLGKPFPHIYEKARELVPYTPADRILAIGDKLHTDVLGARTAGLSSLLITNGFLEGRDYRKYCTESGIWPDFVASTL